MSGTSRFWQVMPSATLATPPQVSAPAATGTLYLIDGFAQIFRAYYAIRNGMRSPVTGEPSHAVFGFAAMLLKLLRECGPAYVAVALDAPGNTFRDALYGEYKGTRRETPDDLKSQIPRVIELVERFGITAISKPGLEADDVIATVVQRVLDDPAAAGVHVRIVSKDKDLEQLLCDRVAMFDVHTDTTIDAGVLLANKGVTPSQVIDLLTLTGDTVDNVRGVDGIGPKTAAQLIQQFGSLDGILANLDKLSTKRRESFEKARAHIDLSRTLVTLKRDGDFPFALESLRVRRPDPARLVPFFQELGFNRFQDDVKKLAEDTAAPMLPGFAGAQPSGMAAWPVSSPPSGDAVGASPLQTFPGSGTAGEVQPDTAASGRYRAVTTLADLGELVATLRRQPIFAFDTETTGLGSDSKLCGLSFSWEPRQGEYVPVRSPAPETHLDETTVLSVLRPLLEDESAPKCGHNLKFDARVLARSGVRLRGVAFDSMLASQMLDPAQPAHKLDHLAIIHLNYLMVPIANLIGTPPDERSMADVPLDQVVEYAAEDADVALRLFHHFTPLAESQGMTRLIAQVEAPLTAVLAEMENAGIICDPDELGRQGALLGARVAELKREIWSVAGSEFNVDSPKQLAVVLFETLKLPPGKKTKSGYSTDAEELDRLAAQEDRANPRTSVPRLLLEHRQLAKLIGTYLGALRSAVDPGTQRIHTTFHQLVTATGRLASQGPNLQNIPVRSDIGRQVRKAFVAPSGSLLICADYSQVELRLLAHLSEDAALVEAFRVEQDIHAAVAAQVFGVDPADVTREQRNHAKTINFGIIYGVTAFGLARRIDGLDVAAAARLIADYKQRFPGIDRFLQECIGRALDDGYVTTILGRRRAIPEITSTNTHQRNLGERLAINSVVQGSAADLIKVAMVNVQRRIDKDRLPLRMLLQIHDELVFEAPAAEAEPLAAIVRDEMERALDLRVPLRADAGIGPDWMTAK